MAILSYYWVWNLAKLLKGDDERSVSSIRFCWKEFISWLITESGYNTWWNRIDSKTISLASVPIVCVGAIKLHVSFVLLSEKIKRYRLYPSIKCNICWKSKTCGYKFDKTFIVVYAVLQIVRYTEVIWDGMLVNWFDRRLIDIINSVQTMYVAVAFIFRC